MKTLRWAATSATATVLLVGCASSGSGPASTSSPATSSPSASVSAPATAGPPPSAPTLARQANAAVAAATSVHLSAHVQQGGSQVTMDMGMTRAGEMSGQLSLNNAVLTVLVTHGQTYLKVTAPALKAMHLPPAACSLMCGKYLKMPAGEAKSMLNGVSWANMVGQGPPPSWSYVRTVTVDGQPAWEMHVTGGGTAYVAATGQPYPLRLVQGPNTLDFTQWNAVVIPPPPPASQVVDLSQLMH